MDHGSLLTAVCRASLPLLRARRQTSGQPDPIPQSGPVLCGPTRTNAFSPGGELFPIELLPTTSKSPAPTRKALPLPRHHPTARGFQGSGGGGGRTTERRLRRGGGRTTERRLRRGGGGQDDRAAAPERGQDDRAAVPEGGGGRTTERRLRRGAGRWGICANSVRTDYGHTDCFFHSHSHSPLFFCTLLR